MEWFFTFVLAGILFGLYRCISQHRSGQVKKGDHSVKTTTKKDDFAGNTIGAFFLMEEFAYTTKNEKEDAGDSYAEDDVFLEEIDMSEDFYE